MYIRLTGTKGVMGYFDLMHKRPLRMVHLEKLFAAQRIRLDEYALRPNVNTLSDSYNCMFSYRTFNNIVIL